MKLINKAKIWYSLHAVLCRCTTALMPYYQIIKMTMALSKWDVNAILWLYVCTFLSMLLSLASISSDRIFIWFTDTATAIITICVYGNQVWIIIMERRTKDVIHCVVTSIIFDYDLFYFMFYVWVIDVCLSISECSRNVERRWKIQ